GDGFDENGLPRGGGARGGIHCPRSRGPRGGAQARGARRTFGARAIAKARPNLGAFARVREGREALPQDGQVRLGPARLHIPRVTGTGYFSGTLFALTMGTGNFSLGLPGGRGEK